QKAVEVNSSRSEVEVSRDEVAENEEEAVHTVTAVEVVVSRRSTRSLNQAGRQHTGYYVPYAMMHLGWPRSFFGSFYGMFAWLMGGLVQFVYYVVGLFAGIFALGQGAMSSVPGASANTVPEVQLVRPITSRRGEKRGQARLMNLVIRDTVTAVGSRSRGYRSVRSVRRASGRRSSGRSGNGSARADAESEGDASDSRSEGEVVGPSSASVAKAVLVGSGTVNAVDARFASNRSVVTTEVLKSDARRVPVVRVNGVEGARAERRRASIKVLGLRLEVRFMRRAQAKNTLLGGVSSEGSRGANERGNGNLGVRALSGVRSLRSSRIPQKSRSASQVPGLRQERLAIRARRVSLSNSHRLITLRKLRYTQSIRAPNQSTQHNQGGLSWLPSTHTDNQELPAIFRSSISSKFQNATASSRQPSTARTAEPKSSSSSTTTVKSIPVMALRAPGLNSVTEMSITRFVSSFFKPFVTRVFPVTRRPASISSNSFFSRGVFVVSTFFFVPSVAFASTASSIGYGVLGLIFMGLLAAPVILVLVFALKNPKRFFFGILSLVFAPIILPFKGARRLVQGVSADRDHPFMRVMALVTLIFIGPSLILGPHYALAQESQRTAAEVNAPADRADQNRGTSTQNANPTAAPVVIPDMVGESMLGNIVKRGEQVNLKTLENAIQKAKAQSRKPYVLRVDPDENLKNNAYLIGRNHKGQVVRVGLTAKGKVMAVVNPRDERKHKKLEAQELVLMVAPEDMASEGKVKSLLDKFIQRFAQADVAAVDSNKMEILPVITVRGPLADLTQAQNQVEKDWEQNAEKEFTGKEGEHLYYEEAPQKNLSTKFYTEPRTQQLLIAIPQSRVGVRTPVDGEITARGDRQLTISGQEQGTRFELTFDHLGKIPEHLQRGRTVAAGDVVALSGRVDENLSLAFVQLKVNGRLMALAMPAQTVTKDDPKEKVRQSIYIGLGKMFQIGVAKTAIQEKIDEAKEKIKDLEEDVKKLKQKLEGLKNRKKEERKAISGVIENAIQLAEVSLDDAIAEQQKLLAQLAAQGNGPKLNLAAQWGPAQPLAILPYEIPYKIGDQYVNVFLSVDGGDAGMVLNALTAGMSIPDVYSAFSSGMPVTGALGTIFVLDTIVNLLDTFILRSYGWPQEGGTFKVSTEFFLHPERAIIDMIYFYPTNGVQDEISLGSVMPAKILADTLDILFWDGLPILGPLTKRSDRTVMQGNEYVGYYHFGQPENDFLDEAIHNKDPFRFIYIVARGEDKDQKGSKVMVPVGIEGRQLPADEFVFGYRVDLQGEPDFFAKEFKGAQTPEALLAAIRAKTQIDPQLPAPILSLNKLLEDRELYKFIAPTVQDSLEVRTIVEEVKSGNLFRLKRLNRLLIESHFAKQAPKMEERKRDPKDMIKEVFRARRFPRDVETGKILTEDFFKAKGGGLWMEPSQTYIVPALTSFESLRERHELLEGKEKLSLDQAIEGHIVRSFLTHPLTGQILPNGRFFEIFPGLCIDPKHKLPYTRKGMTIFGDQPSEAPVDVCRPLGRDMAGNRIYPVINYTLPAVQGNYWMWVKDEGVAHLVIFNSDTGVYQETKIIENAEQLAKWRKAERKIGDIIKDKGIKELTVTYPAEDLKKPLPNNLSVVHISDHMIGFIVEKPAKFPRAQIAVKKGAIDIYTKEQLKQYKFRSFRTGESVELSVMDPENPNVVLGGTRTFGPADGDFVISGPGVGPEEVGVITWGVNGFNVEKEIEKDEAEAGFERVEGTGVETITDEKANMPPTTEHEEFVYPDRSEILEVPEDQEITVEGFRGFLTNSAGITISEELNASLNEMKDKREELAPLDDMVIALKAQVQNMQGRVAALEVSRGKTTFAAEARAMNSLLRNSAEQDKEMDAMKFLEQKLMTIAGGEEEFKKLLKKVHDSKDPKKALLKEFEKKMQAIEFANDDAVSFLKKRLDQIRDAIEKLEAVRDGKSLLAHYRMVPEGKTIQDAKDFFNEDREKARVALVELERQRDESDFAKVLYSQDQIAEGKIYFETDDQESEFYLDENDQPIVMGSLARSDAAVKFWEREKVTAAGNPEWLVFVENMLNHQREWQTQKQSEHARLIADENAYEAPFESPQAIVAEKIRLTKERIRLRGIDLDLLNRAAEINLPNVDQLDFIPLARKNGDDPEVVHTIAETRDYWERDDKDSTQKEKMSYLARIEASVTYLQSAIDAGLISDTTARLFAERIAILRRISNPSASTDYYRQHAKSEIDQDEAFQQGNPNNESIDHVVERKLAARQAEKDIYEDLLKNTEVLQGLGSGFLKPNADEAVKALLDFEHQQTLAAIDAVFSRHGLGPNNPTMNIVKEDMGDLNRSQMDRAQEERIIAIAKNERDALREELRKLLTLRVELARKYDAIVEWLLINVSLIGLNEYNSLQVKEYIRRLSFAPPSVLVVGSTAYITRENRTVVNGQPVTVTETKASEMVSVNDLDLKAFGEGIIRNGKDGLEGTQQLAVRVKGADWYVGSITPANAPGFGQRYFVASIDTSSESEIEILNTVTSGVIVTAQNKQIPDFDKDGKPQLDEDGELKVEDKPVKTRTLVFMDRVGVCGENLCGSIAGLLKYNVNNKDNVQALSGAINWNVTDRIDAMFEMGAIRAQGEVELKDGKVVDTLTGREIPVKHIRHTAEDKANFQKMTVEVKLNGEAKKGTDGETAIGSIGRDAVDNSIAGSQEDILAEAGARSQRGIVRIQLTNSIVDIKEGAAFSPKVLDKKTNASAGVAVTENIELRGFYQKREDIHTGGTGVQWTYKNVGIYTGMQYNPISKSWELAVNASVNVTDDTTAYVGMTGQNVTLGAQQTLLKLEQAKKSPVDENGLMIARDATYVLPVFKHILPQELDRRMKVGQLQMKLNVGEDFYILRYSVTPDGEILSYGWRADQRKLNALTNAKVAGQMFFFDGKLSKTIPQSVLSQGRALGQIPPEELDAAKIKYDPVKDEYYVMVLYKGRMIRQPLGSAETMVVLPAELETMKVVDGVQKLTEAEIAALQADVKKMKEELTKAKEELVKLQAEEAKAKAAEGKQGVAQAETPKAPIDVMKAGWKELAEADRYFKFFRDQANRKTGFSKSFYGDDNDLFTRTAAVTYDMALRVIGDSIQGETILGTYGRNRTQAQGEDAPMTTNPNYNPARGVFSNIRIKELVGEWWNSFDLAVHAGPNAWLGLGAVQEYTRDRDESELTIAKERADFLMKLQNKDGGIRMGPKEQYHSEGNDFFWRLKSTENNMSALYFFDALYQITGDVKYKKVADRIYIYIRDKMFDPAEHIFRRGEREVSDGNWQVDSHENFATDATNWAPLERMLNDPFFGNTRTERLEEFERIIRSTLARTGVYNKEGKLLGVDYSTIRSEGNRVISIEWSSQFALRMLRVAQEYGAIGEKEKAEEYLKMYHELVENLKPYFDQDKGVAPYAVYPDGRVAEVDTGHGWTTATASAAVASTYYGFAVSGFDPLLVGGSLQQGGVNPFVLDVGVAAVGVKVTEKEAAATSPVAKLAATIRATEGQIRDNETQLNLQEVIKNQPAGKEISLASQYPAVVEGNLPTMKRLLEYQESYGFVTIVGVGIIPLTEELLQRWTNERLDDGTINGYPTGIPDLEEGKEIYRLNVQGIDMGGIKNAKGIITMGLKGKALLEKVRGNKVAVPYKDGTVYVEGEDILSREPQVGAVGFAGWDVNFIYKDANGKEQKGSVRVERRRDGVFQQWTLSMMQEEALPFAGRFLDITKAWRVAVDIPEALKNRFLRVLVTEEDRRTMEDLRRFFQGKPLKGNQPAPAKKGTEKAPKKDDVDIDKKTRDFFKGPKRPKFNYNWQNRNIEGMPAYQHQPLPILPEPVMPLPVLPQPKPSIGGFVLSFFVGTAHAQEVPAAAPAIPSANAVKEDVLTQDDEEQDLREREYVRDLMAPLLKALHGEGLTHEFNYAGGQIHNINWPLYQEYKKAKRIRSGHVPYRDGHFLYYRDVNANQKFDDGPEKAEAFEYGQQPAGYQKLYGEVFVPEELVKYEGLQEQVQAYQDRIEMLQAKGSASDANEIQVLTQKQQEARAAAKKIEEEFKQKNFRFYWVQPKEIGSFMSEIFLSSHFLVIRRDGTTEEIDIQSLKDPIVYETVRQEAKVILRFGIGKQAPASIWLTRKFADAIAVQHGTESQGEEVYELDDFIEKIHYKESRTADELIDQVLAKRKIAPIAVNMEARRVMLDVSREMQATHLAQHIAAVEAEIASLANAKAEKPTYPVINSKSFWGFDYLPFGKYGHFRNGANWEAWLSDLYLMKAMGFHTIRTPVITSESFLNRLKDLGLSVTVVVPYEEKKNIPEPIDLKSGSFETWLNQFGVHSQIIGVEFIQGDATDEEWAKVVQDATQKVQKKNAALRVSVMSERMPSSDFLQGDVMKAVDMVGVKISTVTEAEAILGKNGKISALPSTKKLYLWVGVPAIDPLISNLIDERRQAETIGEIVKVIQANPHSKLAGTVIPFADQWWLDETPGFHDIAALPYIKGLPMHQAYPEWPGLFDVDRQPRQAAVVVQNLLLGTKSDKFVAVTPTAEEKKKDLQAQLQSLKQQQETLKELAEKTKEIEALRAQLEVSVAKTGLVRELNRRVPYQGHAYSPQRKGQSLADGINLDDHIEDLYIKWAIGDNFTRPYFPVVSERFWRTARILNIDVEVNIPWYDQRFQSGPEIRNGSYIEYLKWLVELDKKFKKEFNGRGLPIAWVTFGNEYNLHPEWFDNDLRNWSEILETAAQKTKEIFRDQMPNVRVASVLGEGVVEDDNLEKEVWGSEGIKRMIRWSPSVDIWGFNTYRWKYLDNLTPQGTSFFKELKEVKKDLDPLFQRVSFYIAEIGIPVFDGDNKGAFDERTQAQRLVSIDEQIERNAAPWFLGKTYMEFSDEWDGSAKGQGGQQTGNPSYQDKTTLPLDNLPGGVSYEEGLGFLRQDRTPGEAAFVFQQRWMGKGTAIPAEEKDRLVAFLKVAFAPEQADLLVKLENLKREKLQLEMDLRRREFGPSRYRVLEYRDYETNRLERVFGVDVDINEERVQISEEPGLTEIVGKGVKIEGTFVVDANQKTQELPLGLRQQAKLTGDEKLKVTYFYGPDYQILDEVGIKSYFGVEDELANNPYLSDSQTQQDKWVRVAKFEYPVVETVQGRLNFTGQEWYDAEAMLRTSVNEYEDGRERASYYVTEGEADAFEAARRSGSNELAQPRTLTGYDFITVFVPQEATQGKIQLTDGKTVVSLEADDQQVDLWHPVGINQLGLYRGDEIRRNVTAVAADDLIKKQTIRVIAVRELAKRGLDITQGVQARMTSGDQWVNVPVLRMGDGVADEEGLVAKRAVRSYSERGERADIAWRVDWIELQDGRMLAQIGFLNKYGFAKAWSDLTAETENPILGESQRQEPLLSIPWGDVGFSIHRGEDEYRLSSVSSTWTDPQGNVWNTSIALNNPFQPLHTTMRSLNSILDPPSLHVYGADLKIAYENGVNWVPAKIANNAFTRELLHPKVREVVDQLRPRIEGLLRAEGVASTAHRIPSSPRMLRDQPARWEISYENGNVAESIQAQGVDSEIDQEALQKVRLFENGQEIFDLVKSDDLTKSVLDAINSSKNATGLVPVLYGSTLKDYAPARYVRTDEEAEVIRFLVKSGHLAEAKKVLDFYRAKSDDGREPVADSYNVLTGNPGVYSLRYEQEQMKVDVTARAQLAIAEAALDYARKTKDSDDFIFAFQMLERALDFMPNHEEGGLTHKIPDHEDWTWIFRVFPTESNRYMVSTNARAYLTLREFEQEFRALPVLSENLNNLRAEVTEAKKAQAKWLMTQVMPRVQAHPNDLVVHQIMEVYDPQRKNRQEDVQSRQVEEMWGSVPATLAVVEFLRAEGQDPQIIRRLMNNINRMNRVNVRSLMGLDRVLPTGERADAIFYEDLAVFYATARGIEYETAQLWSGAALVHALKVYQGYLPVVAVGSEFEAHKSPSGRSPLGMPVGLEGERVLPLPGNNRQWPISLVANIRLHNTLSMHPMVTSKDLAAQAQEPKAGVDLSHVELEEYQPKTFLQVVFSAVKWALYMGLMAILILVGWTLVTMARRRNFASKHQNADQKLETRDEQIERHISNAFTRWAGAIMGRRMILSHTIVGNGAAEGNFLYSLRMIYPLVSMWHEQDPRPEFEKGSLEDWLNGLDRVAIEGTLYLRKRIINNELDGPREIEDSRDIWHRLEMFFYEHRELLRRALRRGEFEIFENVLRESLGVKPNRELIGDIDDVELDSITRNDKLKVNIDWARDENGHGFAGVLRVVNGDGAYAHFQEFERRFESFKKREGLFRRPFFATELATLLPVVVLVFAGLIKWIGLSSAVNPYVGILSVLSLGPVQMAVVGFAGAALLLLFLRFVWKKIIPRRGDNGARALSQGGFVDYRVGRAMTWLAKRAWLLSMSAVIFLAVTQTLTGGVAFGVAFANMFFLIMLPAIEILGILVYGNSIIGLMILYYWRPAAWSGKDGGLRALIGTILLKAAFVSLAVLTGAAIFGWFADQYLGGLFINYLRLGVGMVIFLVSLYLLHYGIWVMLTSFAAFIRLFPWQAASIGLAVLGLSGILPGLLGGVSLAMSLPMAFMSLMAMFDTKTRLESEAERKEMAAEDEQKGREMTHEDLKKIAVVFFSGDSLFPLLYFKDLNKGASMEALADVAKKATENFMQHWQYVRRQNAKGTAPRLAEWGLAGMSEEEMAKVVRRSFEVLHRVEHRSDFILLDPGIQLDGDPTAPWALEWEGENREDLIRAWRIRRFLNEVISRGGQSANVSINLVEMAHEFYRQGLAYRVAFYLASNKFDSDKYPNKRGKNPTEVLEGDYAHEIRYRNRLAEMLEFILNGGFVINKRFLNDNPSEELVRMNGETLQGVGTAYVIHNTTGFGFKSAGMTGMDLIPEETLNLRTMIVIDRGATVLDVEGFVEDVREHETDNNMVITVTNRGTSNTFMPLGQASQLVEEGHGSYLAGVMSLLGGDSGEAVGTGWGNILNSVYGDSLRILLRDLDYPIVPLTSRLQRLMLWEKGIRYTLMSTWYGLIGFNPHASFISEDIAAVQQLSHTQIAMGRNPRFAAGKTFWTKFREAYSHKEWMAAYPRWSGGSIQAGNDYLTQQLEDYGPRSFAAKEVRRNGGRFFWSARFGFFNIFMGIIAVVLNLSPFAGILVAFWAIGAVFNQVLTLHGLVAYMRGKGFNHLTALIGLVAGFFLTGNVLWAVLAGNLGGFIVAAGAWLAGRVRDMHLFPPQLVIHTFAQEPFMTQFLRFVLSGGGGNPQDHNPMVAHFIKETGIFHVVANSSGVDSLSDDDVNKVFAKVQSKLRWLNVSALLLFGGFAASFVMGVLLSNVGLAVASLPLLFLSLLASLPWILFAKTASEKVGDKKKILKTLVEGENQVIHRVNADAAKTRSKNNLLRVVGLALASAAIYFSFNGISVNIPSVVGSVPLKVLTGVVIFKAVSLIVDLLRRNIQIIDGFFKKISQY
ncbi:MAG: hypothetical protein NUV91_09730, partial [Candidatus Omnitrophica bacterium]|nr:hypothetical protein [Candidatus Omnitrophota bacterium]